MNTNFNREHWARHWPKQDSPEKPEAVLRKDTFQIVLWLRLKEFAERRWLKAHGWIEVHNGWLLPHWHPSLKKHQKNNNLVAAYKLRTKVAIPELSEPFDLNHAANSQRYHAKSRSLTDMKPRPVDKAPQLPEYVTWRPMQLAVFLLGNVLGTLSLHFFEEPLGVVLMLAAVAMVIMSFFIGWRVRRDWELEWAETQLMRGVKGELHRSN